MVDLDDDHDAKHVPHLPQHRIIGFVIWAVIFLTVSSIWGWSAGWLRPTFSYVMCQLKPAERLNRDIPLSIVVVQLKHDDDGEQTRYVMNALSRALHPAIANKDAQIVHACDESKGRSMLQEWGARLLVSGEVMTKDVLNISLLPKVKGSTQGIGRNYAWTGQLDFGDEFKNDLGMQIAMLAESMTEPPMLKRRIPIAHAAPAVSEPHKGPDRRVYEWIERASQLEFMSKGVQGCHMKLALGYIALTLGDREGVGSFIAEARRHFTELKHLSACLLETEFAGLVHHHLGDLAMSEAEWERTPPADLYLEAVDEYTAALSDQYPSGDALRRAISRQHLGMAYLKLAEQDAVEKRATWAEKARRSLEQANEVFKALHSFRTGDTQIAITRLDKLLAAQPPANPQNQQLGSQMQPTRFIGPLSSAAQAPQPPQDGMINIGKLSCNVGSERQTSIKCEFFHLGTEKPELYVGTISTLSVGAKTTIRLTWFVYVPGGQSYSKLTGNYQAQGAAPSEYLLSKSARRSVALRPEHPTGGVGKLDLKTGR